MLIPLLWLKVYVQFGDAFKPEMAFHSGQFHQVRGLHYTTPHFFISPLVYNTHSPLFLLQQGFAWPDREGNRVVYIDETDTLKLAYCNPETAWTVSLKTASGPCEYMFKSQETTSFDILDTAGGSWSVQTDLGDVPVDWFKLFCNDCNTEICNPEHGTCVRDDSEGSTLNKCVCNRPTISETDWVGWNASRPIGLNCELMGECFYQAPDRRTTDSLPTITGADFLRDLEFYALITEFIGLEDENATMMHHRFIYASWLGGVADDSATPPNLTGFMMFTGRRWAMFASPPDAGQSINTQDFMTFLRDNDPANKPVQTLKNISMTYASFKPLFFSMPVNYGGESYHEETGIPWVLTDELEDYTVISRRADDAQTLPIRYLCTSCVSSE
jgi:hypothetical protein